MSFNQIFSGHDVAFIVGMWMLGMLIYCGLKSVRFSVKNEIGDTLTKVKEKRPSSPKKV